jgi:diguanylate cyclase (GGDEF)-like protein/PAS domain S-box-containing protein
MARDAADPRLACALEDVPVPTVLMAADGTVTSANPPATDLLGVDLAGRPLTAMLAAGLPCGQEGAGPAVWRTEAQSPAGVPFLLDATATRRPDGSAVVVLRPAPAHLVLEESQRLLDTAFATAPIGMAFFDTEGRYVRVNRALCELMGRSAEELLGHRDSALTHPEDRQSDIDAAWRILRGEIDTWQAEKRFVRPDGEVVWAIANMTFLRDDERRPLTWLGQFQDITARKTLEARLRALADQDPLTGLANRRRLDEALREALALAARHGHGGAVIYVDLDGFKAVNDRHGHDCGDELLRRVAVAMQARCRATDTVARLGGDEFAVLLPIATAEQARVFQRALQRVIGGVSLAVAGTTVSLRASLGTCWFGPDAHLTPDEVMAAADRAMYAVRATV